MNKLLTSDKIYISKSKISKAGRGVFAKVDIKIGETIEECPVIEIPKHYSSNLNESFLVNYFFYFGKRKDKIILALGFGSIYNHTYMPSAIYQEKLKEEKIEFIAIKDIKTDEEITVNYSNAQEDDNNPLWFNSKK